MVDTTSEGDEMNYTSKGNYAEVNGINMYYEIHGTGQPLVLLHGAYMTIDAMGEVVPALAETRQVIAVELQGHGRTADIRSSPDLRADGGRHRRPVAAPDDRKGRYLRLQYGGRRRLSGCHPSP